MKAPLDVAARGRLLHDRKDRLEREFRSSRDAHSYLASLTGEVDGLLCAAWASCMPPGPASLLAIGGYGRRELLPASDIDLLIVHRWPSDGNELECVKIFLHHLWDLGLNLGHQVWSLQDDEPLRVEDFEFVMALSDGRRLAGDEALSADVLGAVLPAFLLDRGQEVIDRLRRVTRERHASFNNTIYQLEPDLKLSPGGLRDHWTAAKLTRLHGSQAYIRASSRELEESFENLLAMRLALHLEAARRQDRLTHRFQEGVATTLGYRRSDSGPDVEKLMNAYFLAARVIAEYCRKNLEALEISDEKRVLHLGGPLQSAQEVLDLFERSLDEGKTLGDQARNRVVEALPVFKGSLTPEALPALRRLFTPGTGSYRVLSEMYKLGVLESVFPEFSAIKAKVIRDFYHRYTVDEHSLLAIHNLELLISDGPRADQRFAVLLAEIDKPELLTMALLLHDVGKAGAGPHAVASARIARPALERIGLPAAEVDSIVSLIENHLLMSSLAFKRDLDDPAVVRALAENVVDAEQLRLLCLLTLADIGAVGPGILTDWKKDLLFQLYVTAYNHLIRGVGEQRIDREAIGGRLLEDLPSDLNSDDFLDYLKGFPTRYLRSNQPEEIHRHFRMASELERTRSVRIRISQRRDNFELCVLSPDQNQLFAAIVGALAYWDMNILRGSGFTNGRKIIIDSIRFSDTANRLGLNPEEIEDLENFLAAVLEGRHSIASLLSRKETSPLLDRPVRQLPATVSFVQECSPDYSILEIVAPDSRGLLYRIGERIASFGCNIELVLINTEGDKAVDVFYLSRDGRALDEKLKSELPATISRAIGGSL